MITLEDARTRQDALTAEGRRLLETLGIESQLGSLGRVELTGSFTYGLMVKRDIDIYVYVPELSTDAGLTVVTSLVHHPLVRQVTILDAVSHAPGPGQPPGIWVNPKVEFEGKVWNFDIWFMRPEDARDDDFAALADGSSSDVNKDRILLLKHQLAEQRLYPGSSKIPGSFSSANVYRAVLQDGVEDYDGIIAWRETHEVYGG